MNIIIFKKWIYEPINLLTLLTFAAAAIGKPLSLAFQKRSKHMSHSNFNNHNINSAPEKSLSNKDSGGPKISKRSDITRDEETPESPVLSPFPEKDNVTR